MTQDEITKDSKQVLISVEEETRKKIRILSASRGIPIYQVLAEVIEDAYGKL